MNIVSGTQLSPRVFIHSLKVLLESELSKELLCMCYGQQTSSRFLARTKPVLFWKKALETLLTLLEVCLIHFSTFTEASFSFLFSTCKFSFSE